MTTAEKKLKVAISGLFEEVNTFAVETMGLATITGKTATGFQKFEGKQILDQFKGTATRWRTSTSWPIRPRTSSSS